MTLTELLAELRENLLRDSSTLENGPPDSYWSDTSLIRYIEDAHRQFARKSLCLRDDTTQEVVRVTLVAGQQMYTLNESILRVQSAKHQDSTTDLVRITHLINFSFINPSTEFIDTVTSRQPGRPMRFATDEGVQVDDEHQVRMLVDPIPSADEAGKKIYMRVIRMPLTKLVATNMDGKPEIPEDCQLDMLEWAAWRALRNWDVDAEARSKANDHKNRFLEAVAEIQKEVQQSKMFQPVTWEFGFGGYVK